MEAFILWPHTHTHTYYTYSYKPSRHRLGMKKKVGHQKSRRLSATIFCIIRKENEKGRRENAVIKLVYKESEEENM